MRLPSKIEDLFSKTYEGLRAACFVSASETHNVETALRGCKVSYKTKIIKHKRRGREFWVMLVEVQC